MTIFRCNLGSPVLALLIAGCSSGNHDQLGKGPIAAIIRENLAASDLAEKLEAFVAVNAIKQESIRIKLMEAGFKEHDKSAQCEAMAVHPRNDTLVKNGSTLIVAKWCIGQSNVDFQVLNFGAPE